MAKTILVVEDDQNISELLRLYLEKEGYTVNIADDGGKGVELYRRLKPDLVLLDLMLPVLDGWGVLRAIRQDGKTPVIMLTAKGETIDKVAGLKQGADDYITKPFEMKEVLARIEAVLRRASDAEGSTRLSSSSTASAWKPRPRRWSFYIILPRLRIGCIPEISSSTRFGALTTLETAARSTCTSSGFARSSRAFLTSGASRQSGALGISSRSCSNENDLLPAVFDDRGVTHALPAHHGRRVPVSDDELGGI